MSIFIARIDHSTPGYRRKSLKFYGSSIAALRTRGAAINEVILDLLAA
jgi:hypothetical protein